MINGGISSFSGKRVLMLQGPLGPFFSRLAADLRATGAMVWKIDFNGGDWLFSGRGAMSYRGTREGWAAFFEQVLIDKKIDTVLLFGDCRSVHVTAHRIAAMRGVEIGVFEEGYVRPNYITLERFGVNGHSLIPRDPQFYRRSPLAEVPAAMDVPYPFWHTVAWAVLYYLASILLRPAFPHYQHHRPLAISEAVPWLKSLWRKFYYRLKEKDVQRMLVEQYSGRFFLAPLQVHNDAQVRVHSSFDSVETFIEHIVASFSEHAPDDTLLIIKQHPMDRGYHDRTELIDALATRHGLGARVRYIHDQHLPTLLEHARGVVLLNSTVGLSALHHGAPLKVCGTALYDMPGLTFQGPLEQFWSRGPDTAVDSDLYERFRSYLIKTTQLNGSFYRRIDLPGSRAGIVWGAPSDRYATYAGPSPANSPVRNPNDPVASAHHSA